MEKTISKNVEQEKTMDSLEIAELTKKQHSNVMRDIRNMLESLEIAQFRFESTYKDSQGKDRACFKLNRYYTEVLITGYDVKRRAAVIQRWYDLETGTAQPEVKDPQLAAMVLMLTELDGVKQKQVEQQRQQVEQQKQIDELKAKGLTTPTDYYTVAGFASLQGLSVSHFEAAKLGKCCAKRSREYNYSIGKTHNEQYGQVNCYHVDILTDVFND